jgi:hypothetical protein
MSDSDLAGTIDVGYVFMNRFLGKASIGSI